MEGKKYLKATDVAEYMQISRNTAYKIIQELNMELKSQGCITVSGRVNRVYFERKIIND